MKKIITARTKNLFNRATFLFVILLSSCYTFAQDKKIDVNIGTKPDNGNNIFTQPWVWIVGGAVFILLLVALLRGNNSRK